MTDNVIIGTFGSKPIEEPEEMHLVCACGCHTWFLVNDGRKECASCRGVTDIDGSWFKEAPKLPTKVQEELGVTSGPVVIYDDFNIARFLDVAMKEKDELWMVALVYTSGRVSVSAIPQEDTEAGLEWRKRQCDVLTKLVCDNVIIHEEEQ